MMRTPKEQDRHSAVSPQTAAVAASVAETIGDVQGVALETARAEFREAWQARTDREREQVKTLERVERWLLRIWVPLLLYGGYVLQVSPAAEAYRDGVLRTMLGVGLGGFLVNAFALTIRERLNRSAARRETPVERTEPHRRTANEHGPTAHEVQTRSGRRREQGRVAKRTAAWSDRIGAVLVVLCVGVLLTNLVTGGNADGALRVGLFAVLGCNLVSVFASLTGLLFKRSAERLEAETGHP